MATPTGLPGEGEPGASVHDLPGTGIVAEASPADALRVRVHRQAIRQSLDGELWYWRDAAWHPMPHQPVFEPGDHPTLTHAPNEPAQLAFSLPDPYGNLTPENAESPLNYNAGGARDPLLDEARKVLFRVGVRCFADLAAGLAPTASVAATAGSLSALTDGAFANFTTATPAGSVRWSVATAAPVDLTLDLGAVKMVRHACARFGTRKANYTLPASLQILTSLDGVTFAPATKEARPVGGTLGDWDDDSGGRAVEVMVCDLDVRARYVRFRVTPTGAQTFALDTLAVYGGTTTALLGRNVFTGYLGDTLEIDAHGTIKITAADVLKRLADNNSVPGTAVYRLAELGDIVYSLLTGNAYWKRQSDYNSPFSSGEVLWASGSNLTGFTWPFYQGQASPHLGYVLELFNAVGWLFYSDGDGRLGAYEPPYQQRLPHRVLIAAPDGNRDVRKCVRHRTGKDLRNTVVVTSGKVSSGGGADTSFEPNSVGRYGERVAKITDPLLTTPELRRKMGRAIVRDYAWRLQTLSCEISPDFDTRLRQIHAFRAPARPALFPRECSVMGNRRRGELWSLKGITHHFTPGEWWGEADYIPYFPATGDPPQLTLVTTDTSNGAPTGTRMRVEWNAVTDPDAVSVRLYKSSTSGASGFTLAQTSAVTNTSDFLTGLTNGQRYWVYLTTVDAKGRESQPSNVLTAIAGGAASILSGWTVVDLDVSLLQKTGPDAQGLYTYAFYFTWTAPPAGGVSHPDLGGFKRMCIRGNPFAIPATAPEEWGSWPLYDDAWSWNGDYIPPGMKYDRTTPGQLDFTIRFRSATNFTSGQTLYWRMWTSSATNRWRRWGGDNLPGWPANVCSFTFP